MWPDSYVPTGLGFILRAIPGFRCAPPWAILLRSLRDATGLGFILRAIPGFRCAPPWAILLRSLRDADVVPLNFQGSQAWNGVPPETMKMQPRILHYVQDDKRI